MSKYDQNSIDRINCEIRKQNWEHAVFLMGRYIVFYPQDNYMRLVYVNVLLRLGKKELAREVLDGTVLTDKDIKKTYASYYYATIKLLVQEERYQECLDYLYSNENMFRVKDDYYYVEAFCKERLGQENISNGYPGYIYQQIIDYNEERAKAFIANEGEFISQQKRGIFAPEFDIDACYQVIKSKVAESPTFYPGLVYFENVFKCENCGTYFDKPTDMILVTGLLNSNNITFMSPGINDHNIGVTDITEEVARLSLKK